MYYLSEPVLLFLNGAIFVWPRKMFLVSVRYLFISQWTKTSKHGLFVFPPVWRRHCSIGHDVFSPERSLNQPKATRVCIRSINQSNRSISVRLLFLFCGCGLRRNRGSSLLTIDPMQQWLPDKYFFRLKWKSAWLASFSSTKFKTIHYLKRG